MQQMNASILLKIAKLLKFLLHEQFNDYKYGYIYIQSVDLVILMLFIRVKSTNSKMQIHSQFVKSLSTKLVFPGWAMFSSDPADICIKTIMELHTKNVIT